MFFYISTLKTFIICIITNHIQHTDFAVPHPFQIAPTTTKICTTTSPNILSQSPDTKHTPHILPTEVVVGVFVSLVSIGVTVVVLVGVTGIAVTLIGATTAAVGVVINASVLIGTVTAAGVVADGVVSIGAGTLVAAIAGLSVSMGVSLLAVLAANVNESKYKVFSFQSQLL